MDSCKKISELISAGMDRDLTLTERLRLRFHLLLCRGCANFEQQLQSLRSMSRAFMERLSSGKDH